MATQPWLDKVQRQLAENGLPPIYIRRFMDELADHFEDLKEETMNKETNSLSQLGDPNEIASAATVAYRQRTFFGRHPIVKFLAFGVSPMFTMLLTFSLAFLSLLLCMEFFEYIGIDAYTTSFFKKFDATVLKWVASTITLILPTMLLAILYCRWARRSELSKKWMLIPCGILSFLSLVMIYQVTISEIPGESTLCIGAGIGSSMLYFSALRYTQMLVPLAVGLWFMRQTPKNTDKEEPLRAAA